LLPIFALNTVLFPGMFLPLHVFEQRYRQMLADILPRPEREFVVLLIRAGDEVTESPAPGLLPGGRSAVTYPVGTVARIVQTQALADGRYFLLCTGTDRVRLLEQTQTQPYPVGRFAPLPDDADGPDGALAAAASSASAAGPRPAADAMAGAIMQRTQQAIRHVFEAVLDTLPASRVEQRQQVQRIIESIPDDPPALSYFVPRVLFTANNDDKQRLLEAPGPLARLQQALPLALLEERLARQPGAGQPDPASPSPN
jgi:Lon protease-like protein